MAVLRAVTLVSLAFCLLGCPPRGAGQVEDALNAGANVPLRPDGSPAAEPCPQRARDLMRAPGLGGGVGALAEIDANQRYREPLTVFSGPIESELREPQYPLQRGTRFYGRIWTTRRGVVIRYYHAAMPDRETFPICAVARGDAGELEGKPGAYPGSVELESSTALIWIVEDFR